MSMMMLDGDLCIDLFESGGIFGREIFGMQIISNDFRFEMKEAF